MMSFQSFEDHTQWKAVKEVCRTLKEAGYQALLAGGCVRDLIMKREPNDFDIASDATPDQVEALFPRALTVGKAFGVTILPYDGFQIEVATFREDLAYVDGRRPEGVKFSNAKADSQRRDFTVNALFYDLESNAVIDYVDGQKDVANRVLRAVGDPEIRFEEDKLRILRALRFAAQLDFEIEPRTLKAVEDLATEVSVVSSERIRDELFKLLKTPQRLKGLKLLLSTRVLDSAFPELATAIRADEQRWLQRFEAFAKLSADPKSRATFGANSADELEVLLGLFLFPAHEAEDVRERFLKPLKLENQLIDRIAFAFKNLDLALHPSQTRFGALALQLTKPGTDLLLRLADVLESTGEVRSEAKRSEMLEHAWKASRNKDGSRVLPFLTGEDLKREGYKPGPEMGEKLQETFLRQLEGEFKSREEALLSVKRK